MEATETVEQEKDVKQIRDFTIPIDGGNKIAILRIETPITESDVATIRQWLNLIFPSKPTNEN